MVNRAFAILITCLSFLPILANPSSAGTIEVVVRDTDGKIAPNTRIEIALIGWYPSSQSDPPDLTTDRDGVASFDWPEGLCRLYISAKGIGYSRTGLIQVPRAGAVRVPLPALAPFAIIEGQVPADLRVPDLHLKVTTDFRGKGCFLPVGPDGRFRIEVPAGRWSIYGCRGKAQNAPYVFHAWGEAAIGQKISDLKVTKTTPQQHRPVPPSVPGIVARGTVRDESGRPIPGATVYALCVYSICCLGPGSWRQVIATTDESGRYIIAAEESEPMAEGGGLEGVGLFVQCLGMVPARA